MIKDYSLPWNGKTYFEKSERAKLLEFNWKKLIFIFFSKKHILRRFSEKPS